MGKLVRIKDSTYNELAKRGKWSDTMDSIIQRLLHPQNNHGIDDTPKKSEREERQLQESNGDGSSIRNCDRTSRANNIPDAIAEYKTRLDAADTGKKSVEEERQRKKMMIVKGDEGKNMLQGVYGVRLRSLGEEKFVPIRMTIPHTIKQEVASLNGNYSR